MRKEKKELKFLLESFKKKKKKKTVLQFFDYFNTRPSFSNSQIVTPTTNNPTLGLGKRRRIQCLRSCSRIHARERRRRGDKEKKKEDCVTRVARGIENGRKLVDASQNKGKPPNETEIRISKRGIASCIQASCVEAFDVALTRKYLGRGNDVRGLPGPVISTPRRKRILFQLENRFSPVEIKRGKRKREARRLCRSRHFRGWWQSELAREF